MNSALDVIKANRTMLQNRADVIAKLGDWPTHTPNLLMANARVVREVCRVLVSGFLDKMPPKAEWAFELCRTTHPSFIVADESLSVRIAGRVACRIPEEAYGTPAMAAEWATKECLKWKKDD